MKVAVFSSRPYDIEFLNKNNNQNFTLNYFETKLSTKTVSLAKGHDAISVFVNDNLDQEVLGKLSEMGIKTIALRCAGYNNVDP